jgi:hypothetical protein
MTDCSSLFIEGTSGPSLTEKDINDFERAYNTVILPAYRELLLCCNGGILTRRNFTLTPDIKFWLFNLLSIGDARYSLTQGYNGVDFSTSQIGSWNLPELRAAYHSHIDRKLYSGLTPDEECELSDVRARINAADRDSLAWQRRERAAQAIDDELAELRREIEALPERSLPRR